jgi:hypothetical protein
MSAINCGTVTLAVNWALYHYYYTNMIRFENQTLPLPSPPPLGEGVNSKPKEVLHFASLSLRGRAREGVLCVYKLTRFEK